MTRGTTPTNVFEPGIDLREASVYITYAQGNNILFTKTNSDMTITETTITVKLSQKETLLFDPSIKVKMQIRYVFSDGRADASDIMTARVYDVLQEGAIEYVATESDSDEDDTDDSEDTDDTE